MVTDVFDLREQVARDEERHPLVCQRANETAHLDDSGRIQTIGGLVQDDNQGSARRAAAIPRRCFMPNEYRLKRSRARSANPTR